MNKSIVQQIFYGNPWEICATAGGRGGNTIGVLLPGVGEERVTGLEEGVKFFLAKRSIFQTIWRDPCEVQFESRERNSRAPPSSTGNLELILNNWLFSAGLIFLDRETGLKFFSIYLSHFKKAET